MNEQVENTQRITQREEELKEAHPEWSDKKIKQEAVASLLDSPHNPNRDLDANKVAQVAAGELDITNDLSPERKNTQRIGNIQVAPVALDDLNGLSDEEKNGSTVFANGILNDPRRAGELGMQMAPTRQRGEDDRDIQGSGETHFNSIYMVHTDKTNPIGETFVAAIEKTLEVFNIKTPASKLQADATFRLSKGSDGVFSNQVYMVGHSRGTMTMTGAFRTLSEMGYYNNNLFIRSNNPAAEKDRMEKAAKRITGNEIDIWAPSSDPVSNGVGGYPGNANFRDLLSVMLTNTSVHSCGGAGAVGCNPDHFNTEQEFSFEGLDIAEMNSNRQDRTINLLERWQQSPQQPSVAQVGMAAIERMNRIIWQSDQWQEQIRGASALLTPTMTRSLTIANSARFQQLEQLRQLLSGRASNDEGSDEDNKN